MSYGICTLSIVPGRAEANDRAEIVTQLLFGETYQVTEEAPNWIKIKTALDNYECWICRKQFHEISSEDYDNHNLNYFSLCTSLTATVTDENNESTQLSLGATLPYFHKDVIKIRKNKYQYSGEINTPSKEHIVDYAMRYLNAPYLWGGRSPFGIDCSGFSQMVYRLCGYKIPRDAYQQAEEGYNIEFIELTEPGDLAFFDNEEGRITHVGIVTEPGKIIHASGKVRIDTLDHQGIFNKETGEYTHKLRVVKRIF